MKINFSLITLLLLVGASNCFAQLNTLDRFCFLGNKFDKQWSAGTFKVTAKAFVGSNSINVKMFNDVLFRSSFSEDAKNQFVNNTNENNNSLIQSSIRTEFKVDSNWGVYAQYSTIDILKINNDFSKLIFFGNAAYEDQKVATQSSNYLGVTATTLGASRRLVSSDKWEINADMGIQIASRYREISANKLAVYTALGGTYLDIDSDGLSISESSNGIQGIGINGNLRGGYTLSENSSLSLSVENLNMLKLINKTRVDIDSSFRFNGVFVDLLSDSTSFANRLDSTYNSEVTRSRKDADWLSLPSTVILQYQRELGKKTIATATFSAVGLGSYGISGSLGLHYIFGPDLVLYSSLGYGNFTGFRWREAVEYKRGKNSFYASVIGLQASVVSKLTTSFGASFGYAYTL